MVLVGDVLEGFNLVGAAGSVNSGACVLALGLLVLEGMSVTGCSYPDREFTYTAAAATASTATTATAGAATTTGGLTTASALGTSTLAVVLGLLSSLGLASELDRHLALKDLFSGELSDGAVGLGGGGEVDERVADGALGAGVLGDGNGLAMETVSNVDVFQTHTTTRQGRRSVKALTSVRQ